VLWHRRRHFGREPIVVVGNLRLGRVQSAGSRLGVRRKSAVPLLSWGERLQFTLGHAQTDGGRDARLRDPGITPSIGRYHRAWRPQAERL
jgi:hypothetical protein